MSPSEPLKLKFYHLDVFTTTAYKGNPLAIVHLPPGCDLDQDKKQSIARDFNLSETVFLHENERIDENPTKIDIFTPTVELPFAGHPTLGTGWHLLNSRHASSAVTLLAKAGPIPVAVVAAGGDGPAGRVKLGVPVNFKIHPSYVHPTLKKGQTDLTTHDYAQGSDGQEPIASIVKGMTFLLLQLTSTDALARMIPLAQTMVVPGLGDWAPFVLLYAFVIIKEEEGAGGDDVNGVFHIQTRMFTGDFEDPATGSAASTLAGWLALKKGRGKWAVKIVQGVEIGRRSEIEVLVTIGDGDIKMIELIGSVVQVMEGNLLA
ncbi:hypothetical protein APHAL10511_004023 [Amanita phalloides]|nr:hypothetical protein APHAL10511_004023 [Amanita phalloides]